MANAFNEHWEPGVVFNPSSALLQSILNKTFSNVVKEYLKYKTPNVEIGYCKTKIR